MRNSLILLMLIGSLLGASAFFKKKTAPQKTEELQVTTWKSIKSMEPLLMLFSGLGIQTVVDIHAQDIELVRAHHLKIEHYIGLIDSKEKAAYLQNEFGTQSVTFYKQNIATSLIPRADLILCWDKFSTMKTSEVGAALVLFKKSGSKYLLVSHAPHIQKNKKNHGGHYQPINWRLSPYNFPKPLIHIECKDKESLFLWDISML